MPSLIGHNPEHILWWQMCVRAVIIFAFGLIVIRLFGRRIFSRQNPLDIVIAILIGSGLSRALTGNARLAPTLAATAVIVLLFWVFEHLAARSHAFGRLTKGRPHALIRGGARDERAMQGFGVSEGDIAEAARDKGLASIAQVEEAVLERSGKINTIARKPR